MLERDLFCERLPTLLATARETLPAIGLGVLQQQGSDQAVFTYASPHGVSAHRVKLDELPPALRQPWETARHATASEIAQSPPGLIDSRLLWLGMPEELRREFAVQRILISPVSATPPALLIAGLLGETSPTPAEHAAVAELAAQAAPDTIAESDADQLAWLRRRAAADVLLPELLRVLDVREIFRTISELTRDLVPHDMLALGVFNHDASEVTIYAHTSPSELPQTAPNLYPRVLAQGWLYHLYDDVANHPLERTRPPALAGARASLIVALRTDDRLLGGLSFFSTTPGRYAPADVALARRIGDLVGLAMAHYQLAEEARRAAALQERAANLEMLDGLLGAIHDVLDIREVFDRVSEVARRVIPHDALGLPILTDDDHVIPFATFGLPGTIPEKVPIPSTVRDLLEKPWDHEIIDDLREDPGGRGGPYLSWGYLSALRVPLRVQGRLAGLLTFLSKAPSTYSRDHVLLARRIADHIALALSHQRMAEEGRRVEVLRERAANLELLDGLLRALSGALDLREVFDRVSAVAREVIPHDGLAVPMLLDEDHVVPYATIGLPSDALPPVLPLPDYGRYLVTDPWEYEIFEDVVEKPDPRAGPYAAWGFRSALRVPVRVESRVVGLLIFFSKAPSTYQRDHVLIARRIADHIQLAISHQRLADEARKNQELQARTATLAMLDELLAVVTGAGELPAVWDRISNVVQAVLPHDALILTALLPGGEKARVYASRAPKGNELPEIVDVPPFMRANPDWEYELVDDLQARGDQHRLDAARSGYRSALRVAIRLDNAYVAGVSFLSLTPGTYADGHVPIGRRIADRLALSFAREREKALAQRADEATARAARLEARVRALTDELDARTGYRRVIGESATWRKVLTQSTQVAPTEATVLLLGESGTGKEVIARFLHRASSRTQGPFVAINCAALPEQLLEAELFGYERGAFTGAMQTKPGQIEQAAGGTLFLDEVGEMSPSAQAKFLRVLQEREFQRLGGTRVMRADVRVVAATNRDLLRAIERGGFREDLYYRLNVFAIHLPALRERPDDILPLCDAFLAEYGRSLGRPPAGISRDARERLLAYHWPGNVRELRNVLERAAILCDGGLITGDHLALMSRPASAPRAASDTAPATDSVRIVELPAAHETASPPPDNVPPAGNDLQSVERALIEKAMKAARYNKSLAAKQLGLSRAQLYVRLKRYGLE